MPSLYDNKTAIVTISEQELCDIAELLMLKVEELEVSLIDADHPDACPHCVELARGELAKWEGVSERWEIQWRTAPGE